MKLDEVATTSGSTAITSALGASACLQRITTSVSGRSIEDINNYNSYCSAIYKRLPTTQQNFLKQVELLNNQTQLTSSSTAAANGYTVCHALRTALCESDQYIPLPFIAGGVSIEAELAPVNKLLVATSSGATGYTISAVEFVACMVKPSDSYLKTFQQSLLSGREATVPMTTIRNYRIAPSTASADQTIPVSCGFHRSVRSMLATQKLTSNINNSAADEFSLETLNGLKEYYVQVGSRRFPRNFTIKTQNASASGAPTAEHYMQALCSLDNTFSQMNAVDHAGTNTGQFIYYQWASNRGFGTGEPSEDGQITLNLNYNSAPSASYMDLFLHIDGVLKIGASDVSFSTVDF